MRKKTPHQKCPWTTLLAMAVTLTALVATGTTSQAATMNAGDIFVLAPVDNTGPNSIVAVQAKMMDKKTLEVQVAVEVIIAGTVAGNEVMLVNNQIVNRAAHVDNAVALNNDLAANNGANNATNPVWILEAGRGHAPNCANQNGAVVLS